MFDFNGSYKRGCFQQKHGVYAAFRACRKWGEKAFELIKANRNETDITTLVNNFDIHKATEILNKIYLD